MRVVITGAGMVGAHVARELLSAGDEVTLLDVAPRDDYIAAIAGPGARVARIDVAELPGLLEAVLAARPDVVVHTAALIGEAAQVVPYRGVTVNVMGTVNVAEVVRLLGIGRLVHRHHVHVRLIRRRTTVRVRERVGHHIAAKPVRCQDPGRCHVHPARAPGTTGRTSREVEGHGLIAKHEVRTGRHHG